MTSEAGREGCPKCGGTIGFLRREHFEEYHCYKWDGEGTRDGPFAKTMPIIWVSKLIECRDCGIKMRREI